MKRFNHILWLLILFFLSTVHHDVQAGETKGKVKVACIGASITEGSGTANPATDSYPAQLGRLLGDKYQVVNYGISGTTMLRKGNNPYWKTDAYLKALASNPDIVFIDLGGNDSKGINRIYMKEFVRDCRDMVNSFAMLPSKPRVILLTPTATFVGDSTFISDEVIVNQVAPATIQAAYYLNVEVLDMHPVLSRHPEMLKDGVHPNAEGAGLMASKMHKYLEEYPKALGRVTVDGMAPNPFISHMYTADPSAHVWADGRLYVYASHDIDPPRGCDLMDRYHVFSTDDMVNWTDHGEILNSSQVSWGRKEGGFMWAPDCAYKNGIYYFYFPHPSETNWDNSWKIGVATSKNPASDFTVQGYIKGVPSLIDPCVFVDDDGKAYIYNGGGGTCMGGRLKDNMMELDGEMKPMEGLVDFHEATWVHKRNGIYYLSYSDNHDENWNDGVKGDNRMRYATSNSPLGPWKHQGIYMEPTDSYTNHGSIVEFKGQWYAFYHNSALSRFDWLRSICVDRLYYNEDGTIRMVEQRK